MKLFSFQFKGAQVMPGWQVALKYLSLGERAIVRVPVSLTKGEAGEIQVPPVVPNSDSELFFEIQVHGINALRSSWCAQRLLRFWVLKRFCIPRLLWIQYISMLRVTTLLGMLDGRGKYERFSHDLGWGKGEISTLHALKAVKAIFSIIDGWVPIHPGEVSLKHTHPLINCEFSILMIILCSSQKVMEPFLSAE